MPHHVTLLPGLLLKAGQKCQRSDSEPKKDRATDCRFVCHITEGKAKVKIMQKSVAEAGWETKPLSSSGFFLMCPACLMNAD